MKNILVTKKDFLRQSLLVFVVPFVVVLIYGISARIYLANDAETSVESFAQAEFLE